MAKTNRESNRSQIADLAWQIADHQARIQTIAANWGEEITEQLNATEKAFLAKLAKELKNFKFNTNAKETLDRLKKITDKLNAIRQAAYQRAEEKVKAEARKLAENETKWGKRITKELSEPGTKLKDATPTLLDKVVKFGLADGKTLQEYFTGIADADAVRIESSIRQGVESGWTIDQLARNIAGSAENNYKDGIFETSRKSAVNMARTLCNAVSNNAKDAFYNANSDVVDGVEILASLDGRTCPVCASLDRQRYPLGQPHPALPIHHSCRCVLLPVTPLSDLVEEERPMAKSDFMKDAKEFYKKRFPNKEWDKLSDSTKKKYYYEAMRRFERSTGEPAYTQVAGGVSFRDYFEKHMSDDQRLAWLGPERFKLWKKGNLPLDKFIPPYPDKRLTVDALKALDLKGFADWIKGKGKKKTKLQMEADIIGAKIITTEHSIEEDLKNTNPNYTPNSYEFSRNCQRCITAYEARRRGLDVEAMPRGRDRFEDIARSGGWSIPYKNPKIIDCSAKTGRGAKKNIIDALDKMPDGARCAVQVMYSDSGHVFIAEKHDGEIKFYDPQPSGYDIQLNAETNLNGIKKDFALVCRLDHLDFNDKLTICAKPRNN